MVQAYARGEKTAFVRLRSILLYNLSGNLLESARHLGRRRTREFERKHQTPLIISPTL